VLRGLDFRESGIILVLAGLGSGGFGIRDNARILGSEGRAGV
jgi:hypothetical protein